MSGYSVEAILKATGADKFASDFEKAGKSLSGLTGSTKKATSGVKGFMGGVGKLAGAIGVTKVVSAGFNAIRSSVDGAVSRVDTLNQFPKVLQQMGASGEDADRSIARLSDGIQGLPTTLDGVAGTAQRMFTILGDIDLATESTLALNNAFLASGASQTDASRGLEQYTQMLSAGKVDMQSWRTLQETMPYALKETAEAFGFTGQSATNDFYAALQSGEVTMDEMNEKIIELSTETGGFAETALEASKGLATSWQNIKTAIVTGTANIIQAINEWMEDAGLGGIAENFDKVKVAVQGAFGYIVENIPIVLNKIRDLFDTVKNSTAFQTLQEAIQRVIEIGQELIQQFFQSEAWANFKGLAKDIAQAILDIDFNEVITQVGEFIDKWSPLIFGIMGAIGAFKLITGAMTAFNTVMGIVSGVITIASGAIAFLTSPIGLVIAAIAGVVAIIVHLYNTNEEFRNKVQEIWTNIQLIFEEITMIISEVLTMVFETLSAWWAENQQGFMDIVNSVWTAISEFFIVIFTAIGDIINAIWAPISDWYQTNQEEIRATIEVVWNAIADIFMVVMEVIGTIIETGFNFVSGIIETVMPYIEVIIDRTMDIIMNVISLVMGIIRGDWSAVWDAIKNILINVWTIIKEVVKGAIDFVLSIVGTGIGAIFNIWSAGWDGVFNILSSIWGTIRSYLSGLFDSIIQSVIDWVGQFAPNIADGLQAAYDTVKEWAGNFLNAGENIVKNIADGIMGGVKWVTDAIGSVTQKIADFLPNSPPKDKSSPLMNLHKHAIGEEVARGIYDGEGEIQKAMNRALDVDMPMMNGHVSHSVRGGSVGGSINVTQYISSPNALNEREMQRRSRLELQKLGVDFAY